MEFNFADQSLFYPYYHFFYLPHLFTNPQPPQFMQNTQEMYGNIVRQSANKHRNLQLQKTIDITWGPDVKLNRVLLEKNAVEASLVDQKSQESDNVIQTKVQERRTIKKKMKRKKCQQKEGRNTCSNLFRTFFRLLPSVILERSSMIKSIIQKHDLKIAVEDFDLWFRSLAIDANKYQRIPVLTRYFVDQEDNFDYSLILRIILSDFLRKEGVACSLTSKKAKRGQLDLNLQCLRKVVGFILKEKQKNEIQ